MTFVQDELVSSPPQHRPNRKQPSYWEEVWRGDTSSSVPLDLMFEPYIAKLDDLRRENRARPEGKFLDKLTLVPDDYFEAFVYAYQQAWQQIHQGEN
jgi:hypothetical protein